MEHIEQSPLAMELPKSNNWKDFFLILKTGKVGKGRNIPFDTYRPRNYNQKYIGQETFLQ